MRVSVAFFFFKCMLNFQMFHITYQDDLCFRANLPGSVKEFLLGKHVLNNTLSLTSVRYVVARICRLFIYIHKPCDSQLLLSMNAAQMKV